MPLPTCHFCQKLTTKLGAGAIALLVFFIVLSKAIQPVREPEVLPITNAAALTAQTTLNDAPRSALLYALLLAEMAWQNGLWDVAAQQYLLVAQATQDPHLARLATSASLQYEELTLALHAATLWARLSPQEPEAQAIAVTLLFKAKNGQASLPFLKHLLTLSEQEQTTFFSLIFLSLEEADQQDFLETLSTVDPDLHIEEARLAWSR